MSSGLLRFLGCLLLLLSLCPQASARKRFGRNADAAPMASSAQQAGAPTFSSQDTVVTDLAPPATASVTGAYHSDDAPTVFETNTSPGLTPPQQEERVSDTAAAATAVAAAAETAASAAVPPSLEAPLPAVATAAAAVTYDVIVVGAGLAGLKAAYDLRQSGFNVLVLEGRNRTGGRVFSTRMSSTSVAAVEIGAQWFHGGSSTNAVYNFATGTMGITPIQSKETEALRFTTNSSLVPTTLHDSFWTQDTNFWNWANNQAYANSVSLQTVINAYTSAKALSNVQKQGLAYTISTNVEEEWGASASWLSYNLFDEGVALGTNYLMPFGCNMSEIPAFLAKSLDAANAIRLNQNVTQVAYTTTGVTVTAKSGSVTTTYTAQAVVVAVPLGMLKKRGAAFFNPPLSSSLQGAIGRLGMGLLNKLILEFPATYASSGPFSNVDQGAWWVARLPNVTGDSGYWQEFYTLKIAYNIPMLVMFQAGQPAVTAETSMTDAAALASVMRQLRTWYPGMPDPVNYNVTRWWNDPWTFGSYSYQSTSCQGNERSAFGAPVAPAGTNQKGRVFFAGEHVSINYPSTIQGAFTTGQAAAASIKKLYSAAG